MADDIYSTLFSSLSPRGSDPGLAQFQSDLERTNPYRMAAAPLLSTRFNTSTWSPMQAALVPFVQGLVGGGLQQYGSQYEARQLESVKPILAELYRDPESVAVPEGVNREAFETYREQAIRERELRKIKDAERDAEYRQRLMNDIFARNPALMPENMRAELGIDMSSTPKPEPVGAPSGPESVQGKFSRYFNNFVAQGMPPGSASEAAMKLTEADRKLVVGDVAAIEQSREKLRALDNLIATSEVGVKGAGKTGGAFGGVRELASRTLASLPAVVPGAEKEAEQRAAQRTLESTAPDVIQAARVVGSGAMSDREMAAYLGAGPSSDNTPRENQAILEKLKNVRDLARDYNDFREWYRDEFGSLARSSQLWDAYRAANPIVIDGEWNKKREPWTAFVADALSGGGRNKVTLSSRIDAENVGLPAVGSSFQGSRVVGVRKVR